MKEPTKKKNATYKEGGITKNKQVKLLITPNELKALEAYSDDMGLSLGNSVRRMITLSLWIPKIVDRLFSQMPPETKRTVLKGIGVEPTKFEWDMVALERFSAYWSKKPLKTEKDVDKTT